MKADWSKRFWVVATALIVLFTLLVVWRNGVHALRIKRQINRLETEKERYRQQITQDSTLVEQLRYDDYLEEYAREQYNMQGPDEEVYIVEEE